MFHRVKSIKKVIEIQTREQLFVALYIVKASVSAENCLNCLNNFNLSLILHLKTRLLTHHKLTLSLILHYDDDMTMMTI